MIRHVNYQSKGVYESIRDKSPAHSSGFTVTVCWLVKLLALWFRSMWALQRVGHELTHQAQAMRPQDPVHLTGGHHLDHPCAMNPSDAPRTWTHLEVTVEDCLKFLRDGYLILSDGQPNA